MMSVCINNSHVKRKVTNKITFFIIGRFEYGKINIMLKLNEMFIISFCLFPFFLVQISQTEFINYCACRMKKIRFLHIKVIFL